jgi:hypothetical protein
VRADLDMGWGCSQCCSHWVCDSGVPGSHASASLTVCWDSEHSVDKEPVSCTGTLNVNWLC